MIELFKVSFLLLTFTILRSTAQIDIDKFKSQLEPLEAAYNISLTPWIGMLNNIEQLIHSKCQSSSGSDTTFDEAKQASGELRECLVKLVNVEQIQQEIEDAKPKGELDNVIARYCDKRPDILNCIRNFTQVTDRCLSDSDKENKQIFEGIYTNLLKFACYNNGDLLTMFLAEKGPECLSDNKDNIIRCVNSTFAPYVPADASSLLTGPLFVIDKQICIDMYTFEDCLVKNLEDCEESTTANLVWSMFKYVRSETPCSNYTRPVGGMARSKGYTVSIDSAVFMIVINVVIVLRYFF